MKAPCTITRHNSRWVARHTSPTFGTVEATAAGRDEALTKLRDELQYRLELCPCSGVSGDTVVLEVKEE